MAKRIWTEENRRLLYKKLVEKFGSYNDWNNKGYPLNKKEEYIQFLNEMASMFSIIMNKEITKGAIEQQINWALTDQGEIKGAHIYNYILNVAAAYEAGFIESNSFPSHLLIERNLISS